LLVDLATRLGQGVVDIVSAYLEVVRGLTAQG
jgi:hypothetical protein